MLPDGRAGDGDLLVGTGQGGGLLVGTGQGGPAGGAGQGVLLTWVGG